ncbi:NAD(P)/FAD-dependent oxidoreductase [Cyanobium sp. Morenito 9A2]|uniref:NAD(P)/FAD-dependent oxidoreductase n=1 Tax=Cyanobium sp. Morenito 9A2 TaxID=2823718 RepID=UPI0020CE60A2|nr:FAD-dependent oxidoreductase [Cyanobium sp. Morenito 9A2]MCP9849310.1 FAD-dependent oxidoreductase [Cyanobium sp. Morenito 9A2]
MLRLNALRLPLDHDEDALVAAVLRRLRLPAADLLSHTVVKRSIDARKRQAIQLSYGLDLEVKGEAAVLRRFSGDPQIQPSPDTRYRPVARAPEHWGSGGERRPIVVGAGPCGYFAALLLAQMGFRPVLLERGKAVKERSADTFGFWRGTSPFDPESNAQFGEGGAGTFSDGKLYSQVRDPRHIGRKVLEELVASGANPEILSLHRPHIGTFKLATVVRNLRARIEALGGEVRFSSRVERLLIEGAGSGRRVVGVKLVDGRSLEAEQVVLAIGHSARDTFAGLHSQGVAMELKPFAVGLRIEHPQSLIDQARWGARAGHPLLGAAEYKLVHHASNGRTAYSFCMCPGGLVVGAASEAGGVVTNGMSQHSRNERNANSAIVVGITPDDVAPFGIGPGDPLAGVAFQRHWEAKAFALGGGTYQAPGQRLEDFLAGQPSEGCGAVRPSYAPGVRFTDLGASLPGEVITAIREALPAFERRIPGFAMAGAVLTGVETRTSSPLRLPRSETFESTNTAGLYPAGEGAGYAGGILSAAIDGIEVAEAVALTLHRRHFPGAPDESACDPA